MARRTKDGDGHRRPTPRAPLPPRAGGEPEDEGLTHADLVDDLRAIDGLEDVTGGADDRPSFHLRHKPFLHFHVDKPTGLIYADVRLNGPSADFEPVWAATPAEREDLLRRVRTHVRKTTRR